MKLREDISAKIKTAAGNLATVWANEMKMVVRDEGVLVFFILAPLLYPLLYSWIYNNEVVREVPVAVVDMSHSAESRQFLRMCDASPDVDVTYHCNNMDEAQELVGRQIARGVIYLPHDFDHNIHLGRQTHVGVYCDMSLMLTYKAIYQTTQAVATKMNSGIQIQHAGGFTDRDDEITTEPFDVKEVQIFNSTGGYGNFLLPGVLMIVIQQTLLLGIGLAAGTAREQNQNRRLIPIDKHYDGVFNTVLGKSLCYFMIYAVIAAYLSLALPHLFKFTAMASAQTLIALLIPYILACIFFGMFLSCLIRYREDVMIIVVFTSIIFLFMSGISWPQSNIPGFWQGVAWLFPSTFGVRGFLKASSMGAPLNLLQAECLALWIQTAVYFALTLVVYKIQINKAKRNVA